jgi:hypothetical protein
VTGLGVVGVIVGASAYSSATSVSATLRRVPSNFHPSVPAGSVSSLKMLGYTLPGSVDIGQIEALGSVLDRYAGRNGAVFDYSNEPGVLYYLLNRVPGTRFYHVDVAQTQGAQNQVISDLSASRPRIVVFSDSTFGLPSYDGIPQSIRSYSLSEYLLRHYRPLLDGQGQLLLLRDDLFAAAPAPPPGDSTTGLYFDTPACTFGDTPNFFSVPLRVASQRGVTISKRQLIMVNLIVTGWAVAAPSGRAATEVLAASGSRVIGSSSTGGSRTDVASVLHDPAAEDSGFSMAIPVSRGRVTLYALNDDGSVSALTPGPHTSRLAKYSGMEITTPDGVAHPIVRSTRAGFVESTVPQSATVFELTAPSGVSWAANSWIRISTPHGLQNDAFTFADQPGAPQTHTVDFNTLQQARSGVEVEVGSCLQWHGYRTGQPLYLIVNGPVSHFEVSLIH